MLPSACNDSVGALIAPFRSSIPSPPIPLFMLRRAPRDTQRKTRGRADRYSFLVRLFHSLLRAGLSRRSITRPHRSYSPLRLPDWPPPFLATFGAATPSHPEPPSLTSDHLLCMLCSLPRWTGSGARWLASCALPRGFLPCPCSLPHSRDGSASTSLLSRPAQASHALRPAELLAYHT